MTSAATFDAGPLSWVKGEIDLALERVVQGLQQFGANTADLTQIKFCRTHLHQVRGALTIVGLDGVTQFTDALEALLADLEAGRQAADTPHIALVGRAVASIRRFLDDLLAGDPNQPLRLLDLYRQIAAARGQTAPPASELFFPDLSTRPHLPSLAIAADGVAQLKVARSRYQKGLLAFIKAPNTPIGALELKLAAQMAASADASPTLRGFWWVASGFFTALGAKAITADAETKSLCTRIDQQLRQQIDGSRAIPEKLMRDVLFQVAIARTSIADIVAIKNAYELAALIPSADSKTVAQAAQLEPFLKRLREIAAASEDAWNKFCTGSNSALQTFCDATTALDQGAERLGNTDFRRLIRAVASTAAWIKEDRSRHNEAVALEVATGVLLIGNGADNFTRLGADFVHQVDLMVARLHACIAGTPMSRAEFPVLDDMTRRAQEKLLISQVVKEIQSSLGQIEQTLDTFFREPDQKDQLASCQKPIRQIVGALSMLGHGDAVAQLQDSGKQIARFQAADYQPEQKDFELVARQLSGLGFFVEALQAGVSDYHAFIRSLDVKPSKVEAAAVQAAVEAAAIEAIAPPTAERSAAGAMEAAAAIVAPTPLSIAEGDAAPLAPEPGSTADRLSTALPIAPTEAPASVAEPEIDAELLEIFLEEANEVVANIGDQLDVLRSKPSDVEALTTLRRAFHTLKGSSRMVGLMRFGDVAWVIEQVHNLWLRQEKPVDASLILLVEKSQEVFSAWVGHLEQNGQALPDTSELLALGEKLKGGETIAAPGRASAAPAASPDEAPAAATSSEAAPDFSFDIELPALEINEGFAEFSADATPATFESTEPEIALELSPDEAPTETIALDAELDIALDGPLDGPLEATLEVAPDESVIDLDSETDVPIIELASLIIHPDELALANEAAVAEALAASTADETLSLDIALGDQAEETNEVGAAATGRPEDDVDSIDLVSLIAPPELSSALSIEFAAPELAERCEAVERTADEHELESISLTEVESEEASATASIALDETFLTELVGSAADQPATALEAAPPGQTILIAPTLYQIFLEEAHSHVATLQRTFGELEIDPAAPTSQEMLRAAHTVGSISGTVGFTPALKLGHGIEAALLRREKSRNPASLEALETLRIAIAELEMMLAAIERHEALGDASALITQMADLYPCEAAETIEEAASTLSSMHHDDAREAAAAIDEPLPDDQFDESLLPIFIEEAADLVSGINERLSMWAANPYDTDTIHALTRLLHTLKGSARMAGAMRIGALTHRLESSIESAHRAGGAAPILIAALQADFDDIAEMAEHLGKVPVAEFAPAVTDERPEMAIDSDEFLPELTEELSLSLTEGSTPIAAPEEPVLEIAAAELVEAMPNADVAAEIALALPPDEAQDASEASPEASAALDFDLNDTASLDELSPSLDLSAPDFATPETEKTRESSFDFDVVTPVIDLQNFSSNATFGYPDTAETIATPAPESANDAATSTPIDLPTDLPTDLPEDHLDPDLLPIFLEEAVEIVRTVYEQLDAWQAAPSDGAATHGLARSLHTLKGSARMAGAMSLGALTHTLESRAEEATKSGRASVALIEEMKHAFDAIAHVVERLQHGDALTDIRIELPAASAPVVASEAVDTATTVETPTPSTTPRAIAAAAPAAVTAPAAPAAVAAMVAAAQRKDSDAAKPMLRVRAELIDTLVNDAGELSIARARIEGEMRSLKQSLLDLTENVIRLRRQLREIEIQAESQMQSRTAVTTDGTTDFDPLELDRFTRFQEVTRMMAESVNDVATVQQNLLKNLDEANAGLVAQGRLNRELQQELMSVRMVPFSSITERLHRIVRQTAKELNKKADLEVQGAGIELDQNVINKMIGPLEHLLRNAISHGIEMPALRVEQGKDEMGDIRLSLRQEGNEVIITMRDDGAGLNFSRIREKAIGKGLLSANEPYDERKLTEMIFNSGFSTAEQVSQIAGRGVGMDVVMTEVTNLGGRIDVSSESGKGSVFRVYLPLTLAVTNAVIVRVGSHYYAIPAAMVDQVQEIKEAPLAQLRANGGGDWQGNYYPFHFLPKLLGEPNALPEARRMYWVMYLHSGLQRVVVQVDELQSTHEIVVKNIGPQLARVIGIAGATVMGDGRVILILNPVALAARVPAALDAAGRVVMQDGAAVDLPAVEPEKIIHVPTVMVVDDSLTVRKVTSRLLAREGYQVLTAKDGQDALEQLVEANPDVILSDIEMPRMDGFEFARNLRADERLSKIPVIMISSRTAEKHRAHAAELGVNHFLGKPYQEEELLGLITEFIAQQRAARSG